MEDKEVFLRFFLLKGKKTADLSDEIHVKLKKDCINNLMYRSQGYNNAATMTDIYGGDKRDIIEVKHKQRIFVRIDHSENLSGQQSFAENIFRNSRDNLYIYIFVPPLAAGKYSLNTAKQLLKDSQQRVGVLNMLQLK